jgi:adenine-specific DNA-methyltransferase
LALCKQLLAGKSENVVLRALLDALSCIKGEERHFWIGTFYALLMPVAERRRQATYFTPPGLADSIVSLVQQVGFNALTHTAIDPAAGGAAFLSTLAREMHALGSSARSIQERLSGIEIDTGLARLSELLIGKRLGAKIADKSIVAVGNSLSKRELGLFDLVIANPPYGRLSQSEVTGKKWAEVCYSGHINKYALFTELCFRLAKPGGIVALVLPSSLMAGPLYDKLRTFIRSHGELLILGSVSSRQDVFVDVAQDVSVLVVKAGAAHRKEATVAFGRFEGDGAFKAVTAAKLPIDAGAPWPVPANAGGLAQGGSTLEDYGATVRSGYFVWNREQHRLLPRKSRKLDIPLLWAKNIQAGSFCTPKARGRKGIDFVRFEEPTSAIIRGPALALQRTTNSSQTRRLIAARISPSVTKKWGGFTSENHTVVVTAPDVATLNLLCVLLNSGAVDARYRQVSGTASVSVQLLRSLDLPSPSSLRQALARSPNWEWAVCEAYETSLTIDLRAMA